MSRLNLPAAYATELAGQVIRPLWFVQLVLASATYRIHNGPPGRNYTVNSNTFDNDARLLETVTPQLDERVAGGIPTAMLEFVPDPTLIGYLRTDPVHKATVTLWWGLVDEGWTLLGGVDPYSFGVFLISNPGFRFGANSRVRLDLDPPGAEGRRVIPVVGSDACQETRFAGDTGWAYAPKIEGAVLNWGGQILRTSGAGGGVPAGGGILMPGSAITGGLGTVYGPSQQPVPYPGDTQ